MRMLVWMERNGYWVIIPNIEFDVFIMWNLISSLSVFSEKKKRTIEKGKRRATKPAIKREKENFESDCFGIVILCNFFCLCLEFVHPIPYS